MWNLARPRQMAVFVFFLAIAAQARQPNIININTDD